MATIHIPTNIKILTNNLSIVSVAGENVHQLLNQLMTQHPKLKTEIFNEQQINPIIRIFLNKHDVTDNLDTKVMPDDELYIIQALAGG